MTAPVDGAQSGATDAQSGSGTDQDVKDGTTAVNGNTSGDAGAQSGTSTETAPAARYTEAEMEAIRNRMRAADQKSGQLEAQLRQLQDKDLPELEKLKRDFDAATKEREALKVAVNQTRLENAFLKDNKYKWKNSSAALKLADLSKVEINEDGTVMGLTQALDALAKSDPYLLDTEETKQEPTGSTGVPGTNGRKADSTGTDLKKLAVRMPALRSRGLGNN